MTRRPAFWLWAAVCLIGAWVAWRTIRHTAAQSQNAGRRVMAT